MRALVTGAAGFIGSHLTDHLLKRGAEVVAVDSFTSSYARRNKELNLASSVGHPRCTFIEGDLAELDLSQILPVVDYVFHEAAQAGVRTSWGPAFESYLRNNVLVTQRLLEATRGTPIKKFIYASSSSVYGDADIFPTPEGTRPSPISPYGVTKLTGEQLGLVYWQQFQVPVVILRYFTAYGPRQRPDMAFHIFIQSLLIGRPIEIYGSGEVSRDFTYVGDVVNANRLAAERGSPGRIYNIGGGAEVTLNEVIETLCSLTGRSIRARHRQKRAGDARRTAADITLAKRELRYRPRTRLAEGLKEQIRWVEELIHSQVAVEGVTKAAVEGVTKAVAEGTVAGP